MHNNVSLSSASPVEATLPCSDRGIAGNRGQILTRVIPPSLQPRDAAHLLGTIQPGRAVTLSGTSCLSEARPGLLSTERG